MTDAVIAKAKAFSGPPEERILNLMIQVIERDAAAPDHAMSVWATRDPAARKVFERTLKKRFEFAKWMFKQVGLSDRQAATRGSLMVAYLMGESSTDLKMKRNWKAAMTEQFKVLLLSET